MPDTYYQTYYATVEAYVEACKGVLHEVKYTDYSRVIVALSAIGKDPANIAAITCSRRWAIMRKHLAGAQRTYMGAHRARFGNYAVPKIQKRKPRLHGRCM